jgi:hypothetical protein
MFIVAVVMVELCGKENRGAGVREDFYKLSSQLYNASPKRIKFQNANRMHLILFRALGENELLLIMRYKLKGDGQVNNDRARCARTHGK